MRNATRFILSGVFLLWCVGVFPQSTQGEENRTEIAGNQKNDSFQKAKKILYRYIYAGNRTTFYCGCPFFVDKSVDTDNCPCYFQAGKKIRTEAEHVVPASILAKNIPEWENGHPECVTKNGTPYNGRKCAGRTNSDYRYMEADLYNLRPAVAKINRARSNYPYGIIEGEKRKFGQCDVEIENAVMEPRPEIRGDIARIYFYMDAAYPESEIMDSDLWDMLMQWSADDPVDRDECILNARIEKFQENENPFVKEFCQKEFPDVFENTGE